MNIEQRTHVGDRAADYLVVGIDVGQSSDQTAAVEGRPVKQWTGGVQHVGHEPPWGTCSERCTPEMQTHYYLRVTSLPLGMPYPEQARHIVAATVDRIETLNVSRAYFVTDATGPGAGLVDNLRDRLQTQSLHEILVTPVVFGSGEVDGLKGSLYSPRVWAPTSYAMTRLRFLQETDRLHVVGDDEGRRFLSEVLTFDYELTATRRLRFGARGAKHDDRVFAAALAVMFEDHDVRYWPAAWT